jgi:hypothetical protein
MFSVRIIIFTIFLILPKGVVKDEPSFLVMLAILIVLVAVAIILRRRNKEKNSGQQ